MGLFAIVTLKRCSCADIRMMARVKFPCNGNIGWNFARSIDRSFRLRSQHSVAYHIG